MKLMTIIGARPQFIKAAAVSRAIAQDFPDIHEVLVHTGQHYDANMSNVFFEELEIPRPDHHLGVGGGSHGENTGRMLEKLDALMAQERPDWVLVYGDTDSTLAGALAAANLHIPVAHVEAGLRSFNRRMPEEINRVLTDHVADLLFVPTDAAHRNLRNEGIAEEKIRVVGDVMYDVALYYRDKARQPQWFTALGLSDFILCTIHRAENTDDPGRLRGILTGLSQAPLPVALPLHPRTRKQIDLLGLELPDTVRVVDPVGLFTARPALPCAMKRNGSNWSRQGPTSSWARIQIGSPRRSRRRSRCARGATCTVQGIVLSDCCTGWCKGLVSP